MTDDRAARLAEIEKHIEFSKREDVADIDPAIPWLLSELSRLERDLQTECGVREEYYEEIKSLERSLAEAKEREAVLKHDNTAFQMTFENMKEQYGGYYDNWQRWMNLANGFQRELGGAQAQLSEARNKALDVRTVFHEIWGFAHDEVAGIGGAAGVEPAQTYNKKAFDHVGYWVDRFLAVRALRTDRSEGNG